MRLLIALMLTAMLGHAQNFTITGPARLQACVGSTIDTTFQVNFLNFSQEVTIFSSGGPNGVLTSASPFSFLSSGTGVFSVTVGPNTTPGTYNLTIQGAGAGLTRRHQVQLVVSNALPSVPTFLIPANRVTGQYLTPTFGWASSQAASYQIQIATDSLFNNIVLDQNGIFIGHFTPISRLLENTTYFWRVRAINACGLSSYSPVYRFSTGGNICTTLTNANPIGLRAFGPSAVSMLTFTDNQNVSDINVRNVRVSGIPVSDLFIRLMPPSFNGTSILLNGTPCPASDINLNLGFDAHSPLSTIPCPANTGQMVLTPSLSDHEGDGIFGSWRLAVDNLSSSDGVLHEWTLEICYFPEPPPCMVATIQANNVSCNETDDGSISISTSNGSAPYSYQWSNGETTPSLTGLAAGNYAVTVMDQMGCYRLFQHNLTNTNLQLSISMQQATLNNCDGVATVFTSGIIPTQPVSYLWSNGIVDRSATGLCPGFYTVSVTDGAGCTATAFANVAVVIPPLQISLNRTPATCNGICDGDVTALSAGGVLPHTYLWEDGSTSNTRSGLCTGVYPLTVTDAVGNTMTANCIIGPNSNISLVGRGFSHQGGGCAIVNLDLIGGSGMAYSYLWSNGSTSSTPLLCTGSFMVTISDSGGCSSTFTVNVPSFVGVDDLPDGIVLFEAFPNPVSRSLNIRLGLDSHQEVFIKLYNALGQLMFEGKEEGSDLNIKIELYDLPSGTYFLVVSNEEGLQMAKVVWKE